MPDAQRIRPVCCDCGHDHLPHDCCLSPARPLQEGVPTFYPRNYGITKLAYTWRVRTCTACDVPEASGLRLASFAGDRFLCPACLDALFQLVREARGS